MNLNVRIKNDLSELTRVSQMATDFSVSYGLSLDVAEVLDLALHEIVSNIISYGYVDNDSHEIDITISLTHGIVTVEIEDDAPPFNPLQRPEPDLESAIEDRQIGGLGLHLVKNVMDEIHYDYRDRKNHLILRKRLEDW